MPQRLPEAEIATEPAHRRLARLCRENMGRYQAGERFASERELAQQYNISRSTANKVIAALIAERVLEHRPGIGTFVTGAPGINLSLREMRSFTSHAQALKLKPQTQVLRFEKLQNAPPEIAAGLHLSDGEEVIFVERLRCANGEPLILERRWIRAALVPKISARDMAGSFYALLEKKFNIVPAGERQTIRAASLNARDAQSLGVKRGCPALCVAGQGFAPDGMAIWHQVLLYRGDRYRLENLVEPHGAQPSLLRLQPANEKENP
jgi:GntR family transcriptional regulator